MEIPKDLNTEIWDYCRINSILSIDDFIIKLLKQGFTVEKYGATPQAREKIVEKIVNVPVEVIVEKIVEKIVEVPIQMIDTDMSQQLKDRILENEKLKSELSIALNDSDRLNKELELEKNKKRKDIYGE